ncbi:hypothetical protein NOR_03157 [Metarhizium rileyi]|uniref:Uncharacterized protein n=1 Tax=Metarhizium rileyi (strain RCEF 4871) TaxID=1649241 RepID=A0A167GBF8_METRR|nr:hypothetical protein NOR_03157 [Metarhizium rileyi RCEF 4871]
MARHRYTVKRRTRSRSIVFPGIKKCSWTDSEESPSAHGRHTIANLESRSEVRAGSKETGSKSTAAVPYTSSTTQKQAVPFRTPRRAQEMLTKGVHNALTRARACVEFMKETATIAQQPNRDENLTHVAGLQRVCGRMFGIHDDNDDREQSDAEEMVNGRLFPDKAGAAVGSLNIPLDRHFVMRMPHVRSSSNRLQAALGLKRDNGRQTDADSTQSGAHCLKVDSGGCIGTSKAWQPTSLSSHRKRLQSATSKYGCKRLCARTITFKTTKAPFTPGKIPSLWDELDTIMAIDDDQGSIRVFETAFPLTSGTVQPCIWVEIKKPLHVVDNPDQLFVGPPSWITFAIPKPTNLRDEGSGSEQLSLRLVLRYSEGGVPSFASSEKNAEVVYPDSGHEFLTLGRILWYDCDDSEPKLPAAPEFEMRCRQDHLRWKKVQDAMARAACIVEIESHPGEGWDNIAPLDTAALECHKGTPPSDDTLYGTVEHGHHDV